jgi:hypothetical protein
VQASVRVRRGGQVTTSDPPVRVLNDLGQLTFDACEPES